MTNPTVMDPLMAFWAKFAPSSPEVFGPMPLHEMPLTVFTSRAQKDPDTLTWNQAMYAHDRAEMLQAAEAEIRQLEEHGTWVEVPKSSARGKIIPNQWIFVRKRDPMGNLKKIKGRLVLRGDLQDFSQEEKFAPVASWSTVRSFLMTSLMMGRVTTTIDFTSAFVQSSYPHPVWMHMPQGYRSSKGPGYCLELRKSLYGDARCPKLWFDHISKYFRKLGLKQSSYDPCLWYGRGIMLVQYVDDMGISAHTQGDIDQFVWELRDEGLTLTQEESFEEFLGIKFEKHPDGSMEMTQRGLIDKVLEAADMKDCNPNATPSAQAALGADKDGEPITEKWNPRAIVGMLLYLSTNTRPDITFAVSQVARFLNGPKKSHATAIKTILRYLKGTRNQGTIVKPAKKLTLDMWVDADFAGLFGREADRDANSVRSRTGYVIMLGNWPIIWKSKLQTHLSQSTLEAEYSALSYSLKTFLPLKRLVVEMVGRLRGDRGSPLGDVMIHANVFEDNMGAYYLASNQRITNRTKYFLVKWHWFWEHYNEGEFHIHKVDTKEQRADFFTKSLSRDLFEANRLSVNGW